MVIMVLITMKNLITALERCEALAVMMLSTPGPKMIWQFGEQGYDISIDYPCRVCNKPILWQYMQENGNKGLMYNTLYILEIVMKHLQEMISPIA